MSHRVVVIDIPMSTFEVVLPTLTMRGCTMDKIRVISEAIRAIFGVGVLVVYFIKLELNYFMNKVLIFQILL